MRRIQTLCLIVWIQATALVADTFEQRHQAAVGSNPPGLSFRLETANSRTTFRIGERIPIALHFSSSREDTYSLNGATYDRSGRLHTEDYVLDIATGAVDPVADYYFSGVTPMIGGGLRGSHVLAPEPVTLRFDLNEWLRFDQPGRYRCYAISRRVSWKGAKREFADRVSKSPVASNVIEVVITGGDPRWEALVIEQSVDALLSLDKTISKTANPFPSLLLPPDLVDRHRQDARALRYLGSRAAVDAIFEVFGSAQGSYDLDFTLGLVAARDRAFVRQKLHDALADPGMGIEASDLSLMAILEIASKFDDRFPNLLKGVPMTKAVESRLLARQKVYSETVRSYALNLGAALPGKNPRAAKISYRAVQAFAPEAAKRFEPLVREPVPTARTFGDLSISQQSIWLSSPTKWRQIKLDDRLPIVESIAADVAPRLRGATEAGLLRRVRWRLAVQRLYELDSSKAIPYLVTELKRRESILRDGSPLIELIPSTVTGISEILAENLEQSRFGTAYLVARFADATVYDRVKSVFLANADRSSCSTLEPLLAYLLRTRPREGEQHLRARMQDRYDTGCFRRMLQGVASIHYNGAVERVALDHLADTDPEVASNAAATLQHYAGPNVRETLWHSLESWHEKWKGREIELVADQITGDVAAPHQAQFRIALENALCCAVGWLATPEELKRLSSLCGTKPNCGRLHDELSAGASVKVTVGRGSGATQNWHFQVGRHTFRNPDWLFKKIAQYPQRTEFSLVIASWEDSIEGPTKGEFVTSFEKHISDLGMKFASHSN